jgi:hypothetical protein
MGRFFCTHPSPYYIQQRTQGSPPTGLEAGREGSGGFS